MDYNKAALEMHEAHHGKVGTVSKVEVKTRDDLATAYTPGVAEPCRRIAACPGDVYRYTCKGNMVAVVSNGTAVLGLGDIGPEAALPVMEGKALLFKEFGGVDAVPLCLDVHTPEEIIAAVKAIAPAYGGINLEDIAAPKCFEIESALESALEIPVFHDDQHGTAIVVAAALKNALKVAGKSLEDARIVLNGPGAAGTAITNMLLSLGARDVTVCDRRGALYPGREGLTAHKAALAEKTNPRRVSGPLAAALRGADVFIGVSSGNLLRGEDLRAMAERSVVFAMANPTPEVPYEEAAAAGVCVIGTGRSDYPNQINNVLAFPGVFRGALSVRARDINTAMKAAAVDALASLAEADGLSPQHIIPDAFDSRAAEAVSAAVAAAARESGAARL